MKLGPCVDALKTSYRRGVLGKSPACPVRPGIGWDRGDGAVGSRGRTLWAANKYKLFPVSDAVGFVHKFFLWLDMY